MVALRLDAKNLAREFGFSGSVLTGKSSSKRLMLVDFTIYGSPSSRFKDLPGLTSLRSRSGRVCGDGSLFGISKFPGLPTLSLIRTANMVAIGRPVSPKLRFATGSISDSWHASNTPAIRSETMPRLRFPLNRHIRGHIGCVAGNRSMISSRCVAVIVYVTGIII